MVFPMIFVPVQFVLTLELEIKNKSTN